MRNTSSLQDELAAAVSGEIWVAAGTYKPDQGKGITPGDRTATFRPTSGIQVYGGFNDIFTPCGMTRGENDP